MKYVPKSKKLKIFLVASMSSLALIVLLPEPLLPWLARSWVVSDEEVKADAIIVLGGGNPFRPLAAADLYQRGLCSVIVVMRPKPMVLKDDDLKKMPAYIKQQQVTVKILQNAGVPEQAIFTPEQYVRSTFDEAEVALDMACTKGWKSLLVPTNTFHTRRCHWIFSKLSKENEMNIHVLPIQIDSYTAEDWWQHETGLITFQNEVIKMLFYLIKY